MTVEANDPGLSIAAGRGASLRPLLEWLARRAEPVAIGLVAILIGLALFSLHPGGRQVAAHPLPAHVYGRFRKLVLDPEQPFPRRPLLLTALCVALPARLGLVIIGAEGAVVLGGVAAAASAMPFVGIVPPIVLFIFMAIAAMIVGGIWIGFAGLLRHYRGVNETISSLLLAYIAIALMNQFVEGLLRDPASLNKPSTKPCRRTTCSARSPAWTCTGASSSASSPAFSPGC